MKGFLEQSNNRRLATTEMFSTLTLFKNFLFNFFLFNLLFNLFLFNFFLFNLLFNLFLFSFFLSQKIWKKFSKNLKFCSKESFLWNYCLLYAFNNKFATFSWFENSSWKSAFFRKNYILVEKKTSWRNITILDHICSNLN